MLSLNFTANHNADLPMRPKEDALFSLPKMEQRLCIPSQSSSFDVRIRFEGIGRRSAKAASLLQPNAVSAPSADSSTSTMSSKAGSVGDELRLKFLFANQDGVHVVLAFPKTAAVAQVKAELMRSWPETVPPADDAKAVRLICMGRGMLQDAQTLVSAGVPAFETHPTPVNVSVYRKALPAVRGT
ncbi:hypothetical protein BBJ28_00010738 [Nothophytophthora sp. Chile5]|nr:hypothetical protein BBJ28_00010738 [Nothophytophthora sp. Chile5]